MTVHLERHPMKHGRSIFFIAAMSVVLGCSSDDGPTYPDVPSPGPGNTPFNSGLMTAPASYVRVFPSAGTVGYHCIPHASMGMTGTVTIVAGAADSAVVTASGMAFAPNTVSIKPGGYVRWNVTGGTHSVTSN